MAPTCPRSERPASLAGSKWRCHCCVGYGAWLVVLGVTAWLVTTPIAAFSLSTRIGDTSKTPVYILERWGVVKRPSPLAKRATLGPSSWRIYAETSDGRSPPANDDAFQQELTSIAFAQSYFYHVDSPAESEQEQWDFAAKTSAFFQEYRESAFKGFTVREVFQQPAEVWQRYFKSAGIKLEKAVPYDLSGTSIEDILVKRRIVPLNNPWEVQLFNDKHVPLVTERDLIKRETASTYLRIPKVCFVLGSRGSGKTFLAMQHANSFRHLNLPEGTKCAALYFQPIEADIEPIARESMYAEGAPKTNLDFLLTWIRKEIERICDMPLPPKLNMHLSVIVDEAGAPELNHFFEQRKNVYYFAEKLEGLADSVFLVISGTGVTEAMFSSKADCPKYRMRPWPSDDLESVLTKVCIMKRPDKILFSRKDVEHVVAAIRRQSTLQALSTNARCATFLLEAIWDLSVKAPLPESEKAWLVRLSGLVQYILSRVVVDYTRSNGLKLITTDGQLRRVAASVLHAIASAKANPTVAELPEFCGLLSNSELACAFSLIESNVDKRDGEVNTFADPTTPSAIVVTPAIVLILCSMLDVPAQILSDFKAQELVAALHAFGKQAVRDVTTFVNGDSTERPEARREVLERSLKSLRLYRLSKRVPITRFNAKTIRVPILGSATVWLNADGAPGPDVAVPYGFYQGKRSETQDTVIVKPGLEMGKCGLLKRSSMRSKRALDGFHAVWEGSVTAGQETAIDPPANQNAVNNEDNAETTSSPTTPKPLSMSYPFHMLDTQSTLDDVKYLEYHVYKKTWSRDLPQPQSLSSRRKIVYTLSTNAKRIQFTGSIKGTLKWKDFIFTREDLDGNECIDQAKWTPNGDNPGKPELLAQWTEFLKLIDTTVSEAEPRFLFS
jgi:hypothetical protein